jgi:hypothetical protein
MFLSPPIRRHFDLFQAAANRPVIRLASSTRPKKKGQQEAFLIGSNQQHQELPPFAYFCRFLLEFAGVSICSTPSLRA